MHTRDLTAALLPCFAVCSHNNHVRSWRIARFRGRISTQPGTQTMASFSLPSHAHAEIGSGLLNSNTLTHSLTHSLACTLTHSLLHSLTHSLLHSLTHSPTHSLTHSFTHSLTPSLTPSLTRSLICFASNSNWCCCFSLPPSFIFLLYFVRLSVALLPCSRCCALVCTRGCRAVW